MPQQPLPPRPDAPRDANQSPREAAAVPGAPRRQRKLECSEAADESGRQERPATLPPRVCQGR